VNNAEPKRQKLLNRMESGAELSEENEDELEFIDDLIQDGDEHIRKITLL
jgi:hypothetical protein